MAIKPQPQPTSKKRLGLSAESVLPETPKDSTLRPAIAKTSPISGLCGKLAHAPNSTPSVPTFIVERSCSTLKCLKRKAGIVL